MSFYLFNLAKTLFSIYIRSYLSMLALKLIGILIFFVHYYLVLTLVACKNALCYLWRFVTQRTTQKHHISPFTAAHSHVYATIEQVVSCEGFSIKTYHFQTADRTKVSLWRVQKQNREITKPYPVLMMHGLLDCASSWFLHLDKSKSLPYILAAEGYDVWVGNNRGNRLSRDEDDNRPQYWEYNFDHLIEYDQPAVINGVLKESGKQKLIYIGHSQGSTQFIIGMGLNASLQEKIAVFIALGPVVSITHSHFLLKILTKLYLFEIYRAIGFKKLLVLPRVLSKAVGILLYNSFAHSKIMMGFIRLFCGFNVKNKIPQSLFGVIITHEPGGSSINNVIHWIQCYRRGGKLHKFSYGPERNLELYGMTDPPAYCLLHLQNLPFNSYLYRGSSDAFISGNDFQSLKQSFNPSRVFTQELDDYNHLDYVWSESAHKDLYGNIVQILQRECS